QPPAPAFTDVPSWFEKEVAWAVEKGITNGYGGSSTFAPNVECPHTQILTFLWRAADKPTASVKAPITVASYYQDAVNWAYEKGLIDDSFQPDALCTRAQAVQYIWQALGKQDAKTAASFSDVDAGASYADAVSWAVEKGVTKGYGGSDTFAPDRVCNRGEIAAFLYRAYNN
ncbi:MAG: S-layer homology domain-containing protein, partial [Oscillospiraceae bacterium]|nr:S-layer homology domain-containing protein [Oscillospiraceae bacterium]